VDNTEVMQISYRRGVSKLQAVKKLKVGGSKTDVNDVGARVTLYVGRKLMRQLT
jgi:hypothetical protein